MSATSSLGKYLSGCRERAGLSVEAVSAGSRIASRFIHALERDRHDDLPAPVYVRGFIRAYCEEVGAEVERAIRLYDAQAIPDPPLTVRPAPPVASVKPAPNRWRRVVAASLIVAVLGAATVLLLVRRQGRAVASRGDAGSAGGSRTGAPAAPIAEAPSALGEPSVPRVTTASPALPAVSAAAPAPDAPAPRATATSTTAMTSGASPGAPTAVASPSAVERVLVIRAVETTWVRVQPDGGPPAEETLAPGAVREWRSAKSFRITAGNAGGILLELDGRPLPALGDRGQVVHTTIPLEPRP